ncbi:MAG: serine/threonine protein phosphatase [Bacteroidales bacterium]|nr:serine/threonine protein phosphatase [Bacteroidales bacterium]
MADRWVIPDIHGCVKTLERLIGQIQPKREDHLIFLGDYIDRGPDSKGVIDYLMGLQTQGQKMTLLKGNHEEFVLQAYEIELGLKKSWLKREKNPHKEEWFKHGGKDTMRSFGLKDLRLFPVEYLEWMKKLEYFISLEDYMIVHAGLNFEIDNPTDDKHTMLWVKEFPIKRHKIGNRKVIHGHTPVSHEFIYDTVNSDKFDFIDLDNGVYMQNRNGFGQLMALELNSNTLLAQYNVDQ